MRSPNLHRYMASALLWIGFVTVAAAQGGSAESERSGAASPAATPSPAVQADADAKPAMLADEDREFIRKAALASMVEVALGQLAQALADSEQVKQFARQMVEDHGKVNDQLVAFGKDRGVGVPPELDRKHEALIGKLKSLWGADFDREYMKAMVADHEESIALYERQASAGRDPELEAFASKTLPVLEAHLKLARATHDALPGAPGGNAGERGS